MFLTQTEYICDMLTMKGIKWNKIVKSSTDYCPNEPNYIISHILKMGECYYTVYTITPEYRLKIEKEEKVRSFNDVLRQLRTHFYRKEKAKTEKEEKDMITYESNMKRHLKNQARKEKYKLKYFKSKVVEKN